MAQLKLKDPVVVKIMIGELGKTIHEFSKEIGVSQPYLSQVLNGKRNPSPTIGYKIAIGLSLKMEDVFFINNDNNCYRYRRSDEVKQ